MSENQHLDTDPPEETPQKSSRWGKDVAATAFGVMGSLYVLLAIVAFAESQNSQGAFHLAIGVVFLALALLSGRKRLTSAHADHPMTANDGATAH